MLSKKNFLIGALSSSTALAALQSCLRVPCRPTSVRGYEHRDDRFRADASRKFFVESKRPGSIIGNGWRVGRPTIAMNI
jgi:hypothetical protein